VLGAVGGRDELWWLMSWLCRCAGALRASHGAELQDRERELAEVQRAGEAARQQLQAATSAELEAVQVGP
jgi:hypothetical protein